VAKNTGKRRGERKVVSRQVAVVRGRRRAKSGEQGARKVIRGQTSEGSKAKD